MQATFYSVVEDFVRSIHNPLTVRQTRHSRLERKNSVYVCFKILVHKYFQEGMHYLGIDCSAGVEHMPHNQEAGGSNPVRFLF